MKDAFSNCHPVVNLMYFTAVILLAMFLTHPACLIISMLGAYAYFVWLKGAPGARLGIWVMLPTLLITALVNPAFNHGGATILAYLPSGNPLTLESILAGAAAALMLVAVIGWFACYTEVMSSDKFVFLFGRIIPALSLVLSMALRFVPKFQAQARIVAEAQKCIGRDVSHGSIVQRARRGATILSILVTWALENAIETADSMKSRGYGLKGRTAFARFRLDSRDRKIIALITAAAAYIIAGAGLGKLYCQYQPVVRLAAADAVQISLLAAYLGLCVLPIGIQLWEDRKWKLSQSKI